MHWALEDNLADIQRALAQAAQAHADLCVLPELALCGFHRRMTESLEPARLAAAEDALRAACERLGLALAVGLPTCTEGAKPFNSYALIDARGHEVARTHKQGLTPSEATLFAPGGERAWASVMGVSVGVVMCREVLDDLPGLVASAAASPRLLLWPSYITDFEELGYLAAAQDLARRSAAWVLNANWPVSLNAPATRGFGGSLCIDPEGRLCDRLPFDAVGLALIDGPGVSCRWLAG